jgi:hypothetical protein
MGIRFACHVCEQKLNIKSDLAGRRGICPSCSGRFRIPLQDAERSAPIEEDPTEQESSSKEIDTDVQQFQSPPEAVPESSTPPPNLNGPASEPTTILDHDDEGTWYVRPPSGGQYGPATTELLKQWIGEGRVAATSLLWREGWPQWRDASESLPELVAKLPDNNTATTPQLPSTVNPPAIAESKVSQASSATKTSKLAGNADVGTNRRKRSNQRIYTIGFLSVLVALLIAGLIVAVTLS